MGYVAIKKYNLCVYITSSDSLKYSFSIWYVIWLQIIFLLLWFMVMSVLFDCTADGGSSSADSINSILTCFASQTI